MTESKTKQDTAWYSRPTWKNCMYHCTPLYWYTIQ